MKTSKQIWFVSLLLLISVSNSFSAPLNGTYTIGINGRYGTINSAIGAAQTQGISGPVIFNIISGTYNENISINGIPGSSLTNTLTLKSLSNNSADVEVNKIFISGSFISILNLSFISEGVQIDGGIHNVNIINNDFRNHPFSVYTFWGDQYSSNINVLGNVNVSSMFFSGDEVVITSTINNVQIKNNIVGSIRFHLCYNFLIENNTISGYLNGGSDNFYFLKNKITGTVNCSGTFYNNFIMGELISGNIFVNNTIIGGSINSSTLNVGSKCLNNIIINPYGGPVITCYYAMSSSDYNVFYNSGNINIINYLGISYNNVQDFYNATGLDQHSSSQPVNFVSPTDLHLTGSSIGDPQLKCISNDLILDDIDGDPRSYTDPYKGADEVADTLLPVELSAFNSTINLNNINLNWTTTSEINNLGFVIERSVNNQDWLNAGFVQGHGAITSISNYEFSDKGLNSGTYHYRLKQVDYNGNFEYFNLSEAVIIGSPETFLLSQNYPNPFNPVTVIYYELPSNNNVQLKVYDNSGKEVLTLVNTFKEAGRYNVTFDGINFASGVYYYKLTAGNFTSVKKMFLVK